MEQDSKYEGKNKFYFHFHFHFHFFSIIKNLNKKINKQIIFFLKIYLINQKI